MPSTLLDDRGVLRLSGEQARAFLQGLVTNDVETLPAGEARFAAMLSPQGKILFDFFVLRGSGDKSDELILDVSRDKIDDLAKRLAMYRLRAAVAIEDLSSSLAVVAIWGDEADKVPPGLAFRDPRHPIAGVRALVEKSAVPSLGSQAAYEAHRIALALPKGGVDFPYGDAFPHETGMDRLHGVDFRKGCYVGQEVVSRMQHRGSARTRIVRVAFAGDAPPPLAEIRAGEKRLGAMGSAAGEIGLAMLRTDRLQEAIADGTQITAGGVPLYVPAAGEEVDQ
ncbi:MAG TPA: folate-binding protein [Beijerinckiaceae bacterium]|nr:folate-binding protein [Beijerinckiaceae bacterium]